MVIFVTRGGLLLYIVAPMKTLAPMSFDVTSDVAQLLVDCDSLREEPWELPVL